MHTPGPWDVTAMYDETWWAHAADSIDGNIQGEHIGVIRSEANARLIAAAPDLLQAAQALLALCENANKGAFENGVGEFGMDEGNHWAAQITDDARVAIAKATGTAP